MARALIAKPAVRKVNRVITVPRAARATQLRPSAAIAKTIQSAQRAVRTPQQYKQRAVTKKRNVVVPAGARPIRPGTPTPSQRRQLLKKIKHGPKILYRGNDIDEATKAKIKELRGRGKGKILIIVGNGPSILQAELGKLTGNPDIEIMSINKPDKRVWPSNYWLFCDNTQIRRHEDLWKKYEGILLNTTAIKNRKAGTVTIKNIGGMGFSLDLIKGYHIGRSSVYAAMQAAAWLGHDRIYIFGCDMTSVVVDGKELLHFYGENPDVQPQNRKTRFDHEAKYYTHAANTIPAEIRKRFTFCSSFLQYPFANKFNKMDHRKAVSHILNQVQEKEDGSG